MAETSFTYQSVADLLQRLPLFQGMSTSDLSRVAAQSGVQLHRCAAGRTLVEADAPCSDFLILVEGTLCLTTQSDDRRYSVDEFIATPFILEPERLFGLTQRHTQSCRTVTVCQVVRIDKDTVARLSGEDLVFRINLLNLISTRSQRLRKLPLRPVPHTFEQRLGRFFADRCSYPAGHKVFHITRQQLARELNLSRDYLCRHLKAPEAEGLIHCSRSVIDIPALERLEK